MEKWVECVSDFEFFSHSQEKHMCNQTTQATKFTNEFGTVCINSNIFCLSVTNTQTALFFYALIFSYLCNLVQDHISMILQLDSHLVCHLYHPMLQAIYMSRHSENHWTVAKRASHSTQPFETAQSSFFPKRWATKKSEIFCLSLLYMLKICFSLPDSLTRDTVRTWYKDRLAWFL